MNINTIILIMVILVPLIIIIKKVAGHFINSNKRELVRKLLDEEPTKKIQIIPSKFIRQLSSIMTTKYFCRIFYKKYLDVIKYKNENSITVKKYIDKEETSSMESNYFFNLCKNKMANNLFVKTNIDKKFWDNFIIPELTKISGLHQILNISIFFCGNSLLLPTTYFKNDCFILMIHGDAEIRHIPPSLTADLDAMICYPYFRKEIEMVEGFITNEIREGDFVYLPNCYPFQIHFRNNYSKAMNTICIIEFDNFVKTGKIDREIDFIKMEQIQMRKIPRFVYPKDLEKDELELLWNHKVINGDTWEKNIRINNII